MATLAQCESRVYHAQAVLYTYGIDAGGLDVLDQCLTSAEFTFAYDEESDTWQVILWTGSWPFAVDYPVGNLPTIEEAARYAKWLLARENFYADQLEALLADAPDN